MATSYVTKNTRVLIPHDELLTVLSQHYDHIPAEPPELSEIEFSYDSGFGLYVTIEENIT